MKRLQNKVALVTSASKGIGLACASDWLKKAPGYVWGVRRNGRHPENLR